MFEGFSDLSVDTGETEIFIRRGGEGPPLLLLHGFPQTHAIWHLVAPDLARHFTVIAADLRGYGRSGKPASTPDHAAHCKRTMARDMATVMTRLGFDRFAVAGHDRGGRVTHRLCLDHAERVTRAAVLDIIPTLTWFEQVTAKRALDYYHWLFLAQPFDLPERLIGGDPDYYMHQKLGSWGSGFDRFAPEAMASYLEAWRRPEVVHAACEDYRAAASIDLEHDRADRDARIRCPLLALWGEKGRMHGEFDVLATWAEKATDVAGRSLPCGHYLPEEQPKMVLDEFMRFFAGG